MRPAGGFNMSEISDYMRSAVGHYVGREIDVDDFRQAFASAYFHIRTSAPEDQEANGLASGLMLFVAEFSSGHRSEVSLRKELANAIRPFEQLMVEVSPGNAAKSANSHTYRIRDSAQNQACETISGQACVSHIQINAEALEARLDIKRRPQYHFQSAVPEPCVA